MDKISRLKRKYRRISTSVFSDQVKGSKHVADTIARLIKRRATQEKPFVLGLVTGSTPVLVFEELIRLHKEDGLSFENVVTFNLDEYFPMDAQNKSSLGRFMQERLFDHIDIKSENVNIPDGSIDRDDVEDHCLAYEAKIESYGGIDFQILGIGRNGHVGFNEPGSGVFSRTRRVKLDSVTIDDASKGFEAGDTVPTEALSMGLDTILNAKRIALLAFGDAKASAIQQSIEGGADDEIPASYLQYHSNCEFVLDSEAASKLALVEMPWLVQDVEWTDVLIRKATCWLSLKVKQPILKLTDKDYTNYGMSSLVESFGSSYKINIKVFNELQRTITGWPGGKPDSDDSNRPVPSTPAKKRVLVFSPHPDDDVISMGGTFIRLATQGHDVNVAYQVSGNIAVADDVLLTYARFVELFSKEMGTSGKTNDVLSSIASIAAARKEGELDSPEVLDIKGIIRRVEALDACQFVGVPKEKVNFLDLPFYKTGAVDKKPLGPDDIKIVADILQKIKPQQIYAAADLADPHGTHAVCFEAIVRALQSLEGESWLDDCVLWGYRGAWAEWPIGEVEMAVPISPDELIKKIKAIYRHASQKDNVLFPGDDPREFWERARDRNNATADVYNALGLAEYEAMEVFAKYDYTQEL